MEEVQRLGTKVRRDAAHRLGQVRLVRGAQNHARPILVLVGTDEVERHAVAVRRAPRHMAEAVLPLVGPAALLVARHGIEEGPVGDLPQIEEPHPLRVDGKRLGLGLRLMLGKPGGKLCKGVGIRLLRKLRTLLDAPQHDRHTRLHQQQHRPLCISSQLHSPRHIPQD